MNHGIVFLASGTRHGPAYLWDGAVRPLADGVSPYDLLARSPAVSPAELDGALTDESVRLEEAILAPPLLASSRVLAVAQNYPAHAEEAGGTQTRRPVIFMKPVSAFAGHGAQVRIPSITSSLDYEGELAVVIKEPAYQVTPDRALEFVAGYAVGNDGSARDLQPTTLADRPMVDWFSAKCLDRCSALGPMIVPAQEVPNPNDLAITTTLNGDVVQDDRTSAMTIGVAELLAFVSARMTLLPGDVLLTGTPAGVGKARGRMLQPGDEVTVEIERVGQLTTHYS